MKKLLSVALTFCSLSVFAQSELAGTWDTGDDNTLIEIAETEGQMTGIIKSSDNSKAQIGNVILKDLKKEDDHYSAKLYAAKRGKWYDAEISPKANLLEITISVGFISKTLEWKKNGN